MNESLRDLQTPTVRAIRAHLAARDMSQNDLAANMGLTPIQLSRRLLGIGKGLDGPFLRKIAAALDADAVDLARGDVTLRIRPDGSVITHRYARTSVPA